MVGPGFGRQDGLRRGRQSGTLLSGTRAPGQCGLLGDLGNGSQWECGFKTEYGAASASDDEVAAPTRVQGPMWVGLGPDLPVRSEHSICAAVQALAVQALAG